MRQGTIDRKLKQGETLVSSNGIEIFGRDDGLIGVIGEDIVYQPKAFWKAIGLFKEYLDVDVTWQVK